ncbi:hypothetical protein [Nitrosomonas halophila]|uniref:hypothetical protein n=1 Tax=Nitrosomonas halophila TaxID=44576 RepID=UPI0015A1C78B|nr:hypothetical protein [Nitrosomonas halophila]
MKQEPERSIKRLIMMFCLPILPDIAQTIHTRHSAANNRQPAMNNSGTTHGQWFLKDKSICSKFQQIAKWLSKTGC